MTLASVFVVLFLFVSVLSRCCPSSLARNAPLAQDPSPSLPPAHHLDPTSLPTLFQHFLYRPSLTCVPLLGRFSRI